MNFHFSLFKAISNNALGKMPCHWKPTCPCTSPLQLGPTKKKQCTSAKLCHVQQCPNNAQVCEKKLTQSLSLVPLGGAFRTCSKHPLQWLQDGLITSQRSWSDLYVRATFSEMGGNNWKKLSSILCQTAYRFGRCRSRHRETNSPKP